MTGTGPGGSAAALYLVADIGYSYLFITLATVLVDRGVPPGTVALIALLGLLYFGRFLVGPVIDRFVATAMSGAGKVAPTSAGLAVAGAIGYRRRCGP